MNAMKNQSMQHRQRGQTLVIAMLVLGVLLVLGLVFISLIGRNIRSTTTLGSRSAANDLAESGIRYAHEQMYRGQLGADWRGLPTTLYAANDTAHTNPFTRDPDSFYLRPAARDGSGNPLPFVAGSSVPDLGGPDGLGPYIRVNFNNGRALVRVRYAPSDANVFAATPAGALRNPGAVRNYLLIESIGRPGKVSLTDPTLQVTPTAIQFDKFASAGDLQNSLAVWRKSEASQTTSRPLRAFASIGLIDTARFVTNVYNVASPARIGIPTDLGATYNNVSVGSLLPLQLGNSLQIPAIGGSLGATTLVTGFGGMQINSDVEFYGLTRLYLNKPLGDGLTVAGTINANSTSQVQILSTDVDNTGNWAAPLATSLTQGSNPGLDSRSDTFSTLNGLIKDGVVKTDAVGWSRGTGRKVPPSIFATDADTGASRYILQTRDSGTLINGGNAGRFGYGQGIYIDNFGDRQIPVDETARQNVGAQQSLIEEWLNPIPKRSGDRTYWVGPYYIPPGAFIQLNPDGFSISRNGSGPVNERTWKNPDGTNSNASTIRYRVGLVNGQLFLINSITSNDINNASPNFANGTPFNGVIYSEGNIRIRGTIPTDVQLSVVSSGSIYIEGSILKGLTGNGLQVAESLAYGAPITRPSKSALMLMAKDYVTLNPTMFFGPALSTDLEPDANGVSANGFWGALVKVGNNFNFLADMATDPNGPGAQLLNPSTWPPYAANYAMAGSPSTKLTSKLLLSHAVAPGAQSPATFFTMNVNYGAFDSPGNTVSSYNFPVSMYPFSGNAIYTNTAASFLNTASTSLDIYGLGGESWQQYPKFESVGFDLVRPGEVTTNGTRMIANGSNGAFSVFNYGLNDFTIRPTSVGGQSTNDYVIARTSVMPHNIRIEASMFAEEGCFFVIPGNWANPNPNDRRDAYNNSMSTYASGGLSAAEARNAADRDRFTAFGSSPDTPFYGEPQDIKIDIIGSIAENMPPPMSVQAEWLKKWGWIPQDLAATGLYIPQSHVPAGQTIPADPASPNPNVSTPFVPNLIVSYDPMLATARSTGFQNIYDPTTIVRSDEFGRVLPPMPRLPVSPALAYFGDVQ